MTSPPLWNVDEKWTGLQKQSKACTLFIYFLHKLPLETFCIFRKLICRNQIAEKTMLWVLQIRQTNLQKKNSAICAVWHSTEHAANQHFWPIRNCPFTATTTSDTAWFNNSCCIFTVVWKCDGIVENSTHKVDSKQPSGNILSDKQFNKEFWFAKQDIPRLLDCLQWPP